MDAATAIWRKELWVGAPADAVSAMFGPPAEVARARTGTGQALILKYFVNDVGQCGLRVLIENGRVSSWTHDV